LITVQFRVENEENILEIITYEIVPTHMDLMIATGMKTFLIPEMITGIDNSKYLSYRLYNFHEQEAGMYSLLLAKNSPTRNSWLVYFGKQEQSIKVVAEIPTDSLDALWSPDGKQVVILGQHGARLLYNDTEDTLYDLRAFLGDDLKDIHWLSTDVPIEQ